MNALRFFCQPLLCCHRPRLSLSVESLCRASLWLRFLWASCRLLCHCALSHSAEIHCWVLDPCGCDDESNGTFWILEVQRITTLCCIPFVRLLQNKENHFPIWCLLVPEQVVSTFPGFIHTVQCHSLLLHHRNWSLSLSYLLGHAGCWWRKHRDISLNCNNGSLKDEAAYDPEFWWSLPSEPQQRTMSSLPMTLRDKGLILCWGTCLPKQMKLTVAPSRLRLSILLALELTETFCVLS